jgi:gliding motility-associated-like protein
MKHKLLFVFGLIISFFPAQNLTSSLVACYPMDGNGYDPINNLTGTLSVVSPTVDRFNGVARALHFTGGTSSYLLLPSSSILKPTNGITFGAWFKFDDMSSKHYVVYASNGCTSYFEAYAFSIENVGGNYRVSVCKSGGCSGSNQMVLFGSTNLSAQTWYHLGFYVGNDSLKSYVNGIQDGAMAMSQPFLYNSNANVYIGGTNNPSWNYPMRASVDNMKFYNRKLTNQEISLLYSTDPSCTTPMVPTNASFNAPDTICLNQTVPFQNTSTGNITSEYWNICSSTVAPVTQTSNVASGNPAFSYPVFMSLNNDGGNYYMFVSNNLNSTITRLAFGNSLNNTPVTTNLGNFSGALTNVEDIYIQKEGSNWYGVAVGSSGGYISRLNFGTSLANTPVVTNLGNIGGLSYPVSLHVFKSGSNYYAFVLNYNSSTLTRLSFGNSIANTPTGFNYNLNTPLNFSSPGDLAVISSANNWYAFVTNDGNSTVTRLDFGSSLLNIPTATNVGNPGNFLNGPRGILLSAGCNGITGFIGNRGNNTLLNVVMSQGPTGTMSLSASGILANINFPHSLVKTRIGDSTVIFIANTWNNSIDRINFPTCNTLPSSTLVTPSPVTFTAPGTYTINLVTNDSEDDQSKYCKYLTVVPNLTLTTSATPTIGCVNSSRTLSAGGASSYTWYPGNLSGSSVVVSPSSNTNYTVIGAIGNCTAMQTVSVAVAGTINLVASASPTSVCPGGSATLTANGAVGYTWQPGGSNAQFIIVSPIVSSVYTVSGSNANGCVSVTAVFLVVNPNPTITVSPPAPTVCVGSSIVLTANGASSYTWNPGNVTTQANTITPLSNAVYTVAGRNNNNCSGSGTVFITVSALPTVVATAGSGTICPGSNVTLSASGASSYNWNPGNLSGNLIVVAPAVNTTYTVVGSAGGCTAMATVSVAIANTVGLTATASPTAICQGNASTLTASGASTYTWQPGGSHLSQPVVNPAVSTVYTLSGTNSFGCVTNTLLLLVVNQNPVLSISPASPTVCNGSPLILTASGASAYTWTPGNATTNAITITPSGSSIYTVVGVSNNCASTGTVMVNVSQPPPLFALASSNNICGGSSVSLTAGGASTYTWMPGNLSAPSVTVSPTVSTIYTVTGANNNNCTSVQTLTVNVTPSPTLNISSTSNPVCSGTAVTLSGSGALSYTWQPGPLITSNIVVSPASTLIYTLTGINASGCTSVKMYTQTVNPTPVIGLVANTPVCAGNTATIFASGASGNYTFNPGNIQASSAIVSPAASTIYTVTGSIGACSSNGTVQVVVNPAPNVSAAASPTQICNGQQSVLSANGAGSYTWNPTGMPGQAITVAPSVNTVYTVTGRNGQCSRTATVAVVVVPVPVISASASKTLICAGESVTLNAVGAANYSWQPGSGFGGQIVATPSVSTVYTVLASGGNCGASGTISITVIQGPVVTINSASTSICNGSTLVLSGSGATSYTWLPGNSSLANLTITPSANTSYTLVGENVSGCESETAINITVLALPVFSLSSSGTICPGTSATLTATGANTYSWMPNSTVGSSVIVTPTVTTQYTVNGYGVNGCMTTEFVTAFVVTVPGLSVTPAGSVICSGATVSALASGAESYTWMPGETNGAVVVLEPVATTMYTLMASVQSCIYRSVFTVTVTDCVAPVFGLTSAAATPVLYNGNFYILNFSITAVNQSSVPLINVILNDDLATTFPAPCSYSVMNQPVVRSVNSGLNINPSFNGSSDLTLTSGPTSTLFANKRDTIVLAVLVEPNGFYGPVKNSIVGFAEGPGHVIVSDSSNNGFIWDPDHDGNPRNNNEITIIDLQQITLFVPNGFSPNSDGKYDQFVIKGLEGRSARLTVFNRWGSKIFETSGTDLVWDGVATNGVQFGKGKVPAATYFYVLEFADGIHESKTGFIQVEY